MTNFAPNSPKALVRLLPMAPAPPVTRMVFPYKTYDNPVQSIIFSPIPI